MDGARNFPLSFRFLEIRCKMSSIINGEIVYGKDSLGGR